MSEHKTGVKSGMATGKTAGGLVGAGLGLLTCPWTKCAGLTAIGAGAGVAGGAIVGGRVGGRHFGQKITLIRIIPETPDTSNRPSAAPSGNDAPLDQP